MTTNTPNKELIFPFGETPEEVIEERMDAFPSQDAGEESLPSHHRMICTMSVPDLLTVLDALAVGSMATAQAYHHGSMVQSVLGKCEASRKLRISILAALGINEGGE